MKHSLAMSYIDLENVKAISRGSEEKFRIYLSQFIELMPGRIIKLKEELQREDRKGIRQVLHNMNPQIQFFGVPNVVEPIIKLEWEYMTMPMDELKSMVTAILYNLELAIKEVEEILAGKN